VKTFVIAASVLILGAPAAGATELQKSRVQVSFRLPDGTTRSTVLTAEQARSLAGAADEYRIEWWLRAARAELSIPDVFSCGTGGPEIKSVVSVSGTETPDDAWSLIQPRHDLPHVSLAYEVGSCQ